MRERLCRTLLPFILLGAAVTSCGSPAPAPAPATGLTRDMPVSKVGTTFVIDFIGSVASPMNKTSVNVSGSQPLRVSGWAVDLPAKAVAANVDVVIDGVPYAARYGMPRNDVAAYLQDPKYERSGFEYMVPARQLSKGTHTISVRVIMSDGKAYVQSPGIAMNVE